jgi:hypothetical protein
MVFDATFNNISVISCRSVLFVQETEWPGENHQPVAKLYHIVITHFLGYIKDGKTPQT